MKNKITEREIDKLWFKALKISVSHDEPYTRYRFAELIAAAEREECAKVCEELEVKMWAEYKTGYAKHDEGRSDGATECAAAIRARGNDD